MTAMTEGADDVESETVLTFGNSGRKVYHRPVLAPGGGTQPACGDTGGSVFAKERSLIESHYDPCEACYPDRGAE